MKNWLVGYAEKEITPKDENIAMTGYIDFRVGKGVLTPLIAQAVVLQSANQKKPHIILAADIIAFDEVLVEKIRLYLKNKFGIPAKNIILSASHTHWGPAVTFNLNPMMRNINSSYLDFLNDSIYSVIDKAIKNLKEASMFYTSTEAQIGVNRRKKNKEGHIQMDLNQEGYYDKHTPVFLIKRKEGGDILLTSHACHPTSTGKNIHKWCADYPGRLRDYVQAKLGKETKLIFCMGAGANAKTCHKDRKSGQLVFTDSPSDSKKAGEHLGKLIIESINKNKMIALPSHLKTNLVSSSLGLQKGMTQKQIKELATMEGTLSNYKRWWAHSKMIYPDLRKEIPYSAQSWNFNNQVTLLALEGELCAELGAIAREMVNTPEGAVFAYTNSIYGYIPTKNMLDEGGYEADAAYMVYNLPAPFSFKVENEFKSIVRAAIGKD